MRINPISNNAQIFRAQECPLGYDDQISVSRRKYIREHYNPIPYYDILENNGRLEEYELNKLIGGILGKHVDAHSLMDIVKSKSMEPDEQLPDENENLEQYDLEHYPLVDANTMHSLNFYNLKQILNSNSYRGSVANIDKSSMKKLAKAGIKRVVALAYLPYSEKDFAKRGLEYKNFSHIDNVFNHSKFRPEQEVQFKIDMAEENGIYYTKEEKDKLLQEEIDKQKEKTSDFIDYFVDFIQTMQKENVYIGCSLGTIRTDNVLMLNHFFNPNAQKTPNCISFENKENLFKIKDFYYKLPLDAKKKMGWNAKFDKNFIPNLEQLIRV